MSRSPEIDAILQLHRSGRVIEDREAHALAAEVERLEEAHVEAMCCLAKHAREAAHQKQRAEAAEARVARMTEMLLAYDAERALYLRRLLWLHDCSTGTTDADGYEWGIYRVKWVNGQAVEVWQTNSDFSDLDAAIERDGYKLPASAKALEARVKVLEADLAMVTKMLDGAGICMPPIFPPTPWTLEERMQIAIMSATDDVDSIPKATEHLQLKARVRELEAQNARLRAALEWWRELRDESKGVAGYHLNGAIAEWGEFEDPTDAALNGEEAST